MDVKSFNVSDAIFETKGGLRASMHAVSSADAFDAAAARLVAEHLPAGLRSLDLSRSYLGPQRMEAMAAALGASELRTLKCAPPNPSSVIVGG